MSKVKWIIKGQDLPPGLISEFMNNYGCGYLLASVLCTRGIKSAKEAEDFLSKNGFWHDPMELPDMALAVNRIKKARNNNETVAVFGDYDADGITATAIMKDCLEAYGINVISYIPDRMDEGYGMNNEAIDKLHALGVKLIVTVDCGISCADEIEYAYKLGIDTVVTDHHNCPENLPRCSAIVNPKRKDSLYPCSYLAGAGVAYKVASALIGIESADKYLELAAIGTIADVVELTGENRKIASDGIAKMNESPSPGIEAILAAASKNEVDSGAVAFIIAPRINCAGRMENPDIAYRLVTCNDFEKASEYAAKLNELNRKRQKNEQEIYDEAIEIIKKKGLQNDRVIVVGKEGWNPGVIGIAASKITERAYRPCILIAYGDDGLGRASGRSIEGFNLYDAIKASEKHLVKFGGHAQAAGLSIAKDCEEAFREAINSFAKENFTTDTEIKKVYIDALIEPEMLAVKNIKELSDIEPCGAGNEKPVFAMSNMKIHDMRELSEGKHLKLTLKKHECFVDAIAFGYGALAKKLYKGMEIHVAGNVDINDYTGNPQLVVKEILY